MKGKLLTTNTTDPSDEDPAEDDNMPLIIKLTVQGVTNYDITKITGFAMVNNQNAILKHIYNCPNRCEFKSDGSLPEFNAAPCTVVDTTSYEQEDKYYKWWIK